MEKTILSNLLNNEDYSRKVLPFLKPEYFKDRTEEILFKAIANFTVKYNTIPTQESLLIDLDGDTTINETEMANCQQYFEPFEPKNEEWLIENTPPSQPKKSWMKLSAVTSMSIMKVKSDR